MNLICACDITSSLSATPGREMISIAGRQAGFAHVRENLASTLGLQVEEAQPLRGVAELGNAARPDRSGEWAVAAGLSLYPLNARAHAGVAA